MDKDIERQLQDAKKASRYLLNVDSQTKAKALQAMSDILRQNSDLIVSENQKDIDNARLQGLSEAMIDRLLLDQSRIENMAQDILKVIDLKDPIGDVVREINRPNGLKIVQVRIPIGVIGVIYESRPNVTVDIASLCIKTNNVCVLKGGKEALHSNRILVSLMNQAIQDILPKHTITLLELSRDHINDMLKANQYIDVIIPRGSARLIQSVVQNASVPVIETGAGICHLYIDKDADCKKAIDIAINAKIQRPSVCNAIETILVHQDIAKTFLPLLQDAFKDKVKIYGDQESLKYVEGTIATHQNYASEYDDYICNIKVVKSINEAIEHIYQYSTHHSESIISEDDKRAQYFMDALDSACVYHNASTRFSDGGEFGFGAEVGISTQKLHARGPLGLQEITSTQYKIYGNGQVR